jgi:hypothetical protein
MKKSEPRVVVLLEKQGFASRGSALAGGEKVVFLIGKPFGRHLHEKPVSGGEGGVVGAEMGVAGELEPLRQGVHADKVITAGVGCTGGGQGGKIAEGGTPVAEGELNTRRMSRVAGAEGGGRRLHPRDIIVEGRVLRRKLDQQGGRRAKRDENGGEKGEFSFGEHHFGGDHCKYLRKVSTVLTLLGQA